MAKRNCLYLYVNTLNFSRVSHCTIFRGKVTNEKTPRYMMDRIFLHDSLGRNLMVFRVIHNKKIEWKNSIFCRKNIFWKQILNRSNKLILFLLTMLCSLAVPAFIQIDYMINEDLVSFFYYRTFINFSHKIRWRVLKQSKTFHSCWFSVGSHNW